MQITINGTATTVASGQTLAQLLVSHIADTRGVAVALNDTVVPKGQWPTTPLTDGDKVLIIRATKGG